jgi:transcriptional regulator with XRE-family HTH domain
MDDSVVQVEQSRGQMIDLGRRLREEREEQGISFAEAEAGTRIKARYLKAIEKNDWAALPTHVQARGFLRNYAVFLGLDGDEVMSSFSQVTRSASINLPSSPAQDTGVRTTSADGAVFRPRNIDIDQVSVLRRWLNSDVVIGLALALMVIVIGFGLLQILPGGSDEVAGSGVTTPALTPVVTDNAPEVTLQAGDTQEEATPMATRPTFAAVGETVQLRLEATEHVWVRVTVDGVQVLEGILAPNTVQDWEANRQILLETPNAAGLQVDVNGQPQGALGERGQAIVLAWGPNGRVPITPTVAP